MAALSSLYSSVRLFAQQCPDTTIDKFLVESIREFCRQSWFLQETLLINIVADTATYTITPTSSQEVINVEAVKVDGNPYPATRLQDIAEYTDDYTRKSYSFEPNGSLTIYPTPTANSTNGLSVRAVIMPPEGATTVPDVILRHFKETIVAGALKDLLQMQNESWTNPNMAASKRMEFILGVNKAKIDRARGFQNKDLTLRSRPFLV